MKMEVTNWCRCTEQWTEMKQIVRTDVGQEDTMIMKYECPDCKSKTATVLELKEGEN